MSDVTVNPTAGTVNDIDPERRYLPDFWLHRQSAFVEIKRRYFEEDQDEYIRATMKLAALACDRGSGIFARTVILCAGNPYPNEYQLTCTFAGQPFDSILSGVWAVDRKDPKSLWVVNPETSAASCLNRASVEHDKHPLIECDQLSAAYSAARSARFEHGESGA